jgi:hypothetical protein
MGPVRLVTSGRLVAVADEGDGTANAGAEEDDASALAAGRPRHLPDVAGIVPCPGGTSRRAAGASSAQAIEEENAVEVVDLAEWPAP